MSEVDESLLRKRIFFKKGVLHKFVAYICAKPNKWKKPVITGIIVFLVVIFLWHLMVGFYAKNLVAQGERYIREQNSQEAVNVLTKAIKLNSSLLDAHLFLAQAYIMEGKPSLAVDKLLEANKIFPDNPQLLALLKYAYQREFLSSSGILKIGIQSELNPFTVLKMIQPLVHYLSQNLERNVSLVFLSHSDSVDSWVNEKKIDIAIIGPENLTGFKYTREITPLVLVSPRDGNFQRSVIVTSRRNIQNIRDLKGKSFAFAKKNSLTGYLLPRMTLLRQGIDPEKDFSRVYFMNSQEEVFLNLLEGEIDAGALADYIFDYLTSISPIPEKIHPLAYSRKVPANILIVGVGIPAEFAEKIKYLLLNYSMLAEKKDEMFLRYTGINIKEENSKEGEVYTIVFEKL